MYFLSFFGGKAYNTHLPSQIRCKDSTFFSMKRINRYFFSFFSKKDKKTEKRGLAGRIFWGEMARREDERWTSGGEKAILPAVPL